jgi:glutathione S-transferase
MTGRRETSSPGNIAIIEYLEEQYPDPPLLPADPVLRARVRSVAATIGCDILQLHNTSTLNYVRREFARSEADLQAWVAR